MPTPLTAIAFMLATKRPTKSIRSFRFSKRLPRRTKMRPWIGSCGLDRDIGSRPGGPRAQPTGLSERTKTKVGLGSPVSMNYYERRPFEFAARCRKRRSCCRRLMVTTISRRMTMVPSTSGSVRSSPRGRPSRTGFRRSMGVTFSLRYASTARRRHSTTRPGNRTISSK